jgi:hypothetical protein
MFARTLALLLSVIELCAFAALAGFIAMMVSKPL